ncbi:MAG: hypothetical protein QOH52_2680, partial [Pseudonocardiales bacterium]|nr:hypothetical protein [Pseudonocardiales bacterium]
AAKIVIMEQVQKQLVPRQDSSLNRTQKRP